MARQTSDADARIILPPLHPAQAEIARHPARFRVVCCGRRFGKTGLAVVVALAEALRGGTVMWTAPTTDKTGIGWRLFRELTAQIPLAAVRAAERRIEVASGGWIMVRSADTRGGLRSEGLSLAIVDEAAHIPDLDRIWDQELRPALTDRKGRALIISTPNGYNYFYALFRRGQDSGDGEWASWQMPSAANPYLDPAEIEAARRDLPELVWRQEYLAEFVQLSGALFRRELFRVADELPSLKRQVRYWDLASSLKTSADYTVGARVGVSADGIVCITDIVRGRWEWPDAARIIADTARADGPSVRQHIEATGTQRGMVQLLYRDPALLGVRIVPTEVVGDKLQRALPWLGRAEAGRVWLQRATWNGAFVDEVCAFPQGSHDDQVDAVSGAVQALLSDTGPLLLWGRDQ